MNYFNRDNLQTRRRRFKFSSAVILYIMSIEVFLCSARPTPDNSSVREIDNTTDTGVIKLTKELPGYPDNIGENSSNEDEDCEDEFECTEAPPTPDATQKHFNQLKPTFDNDTDTGTVQPQSTTDEENLPDATTTSFSRYNNNNNDEHPTDESIRISSTTPIQIPSTTIRDEVEPMTSTSSMLPTTKIKAKARSGGLTMTNSIFILLISILSTYFL